MLFAKPCIDWLISTNMLYNWRGCLRYIVWGIIHCHGLIQLITLLTSVLMIRYVQPTTNSCRTNTTSPYGKSIVDTIFLTIVSMNNKPVFFLSYFWPLWLGTVFANVFWESSQLKRLRPGTHSIVDSFWYPERQTLRLTICKRQCGPYLYSLASRWQKARVVICF